MAGTRRHQRWRQADIGLSWGWAMDWGGVCSGGLSRWGGGVGGCWGWAMDWGGVCSGGLSRWGGGVGGCWGWAMDWAGVCRRWSFWGGGVDLNIVCFSGIRAPVLCVLSGLWWVELWSGGRGVGGGWGSSGFFFSGCDAVASAWRLSLILHSRLTGCRMDSTRSGLHFLLVLLVGGVRGWRALWYYSQRLWPLEVFTRRDDCAILTGGTVAQTVGRHWGR